MLTLFFHLRIGDQLISDPEGASYAATDDAIESARQILCDQMRAGHLDLTQSFEISDDRNGVLISTLRFRDALFDCDVIEQAAEFSAIKASACSPT